MRKKKFNVWSVLVVFIVFITVIVALVQHNNPLPGYQGSTEKLSSGVSSATSGSIVQMTQYENDTPDFTVKVPANWTKVVKSGYITWVDKVTGSSFQIQISDSTLDNKNVTEDSVGAELSAAGAELVQFYWIDEWDYACMYHTYEDSGCFDNIEITAFDEQYIVRFVFVADEAYYSQIQDTIAQVIDSFNWDRFADQ